MAGGKAACPFCGAWRRCALWRGVRCAAPATAMAAWRPQVRREDGRPLRSLPRLKLLTRSSVPLAMIIRTLDRIIRTLYRIISTLETIYVPLKRLYVLVRLTCANTVRARCSRVVPCCACCPLSVVCCMWRVASGMAWLRHAATLCTASSSHPVHLACRPSHVARCVRPIVRRTVRNGVVRCA